YSPTMVSDGDEGMIVVWQDLRADGGDVYVQRITSDGIAQWETDGKVIANPALNQYWPRITADGAGGAVITWAGQTASFIEIRAQGITASGKL
ncbi:MAG: hypothetical protein OEX00_04340, partial [Gammaproteobacteria bacterium]|nr:hypothetical protein [Gammaproteobacteria bacterium]